MARPDTADRRRREKTSALIDRLKDWIAVGETKPLRSVGPWLRGQMQNYDDVLKSIDEILASLLELWSEDFELKPGQG